LAYGVSEMRPEASAGSGFATGWPVKLLLLTLAVPFFFPIGPLFLTADRIFLLIAIVPCLVIWAGGMAGRRIFADYALLLYCLWMGLSSFVLDGPAVAVEASGINLIETFGAYLVGRCLVRDADSFRAVVRFFFLLILVMLPFAIQETLTGRNALLELANGIWPSYADVPKDPRWGLDRVALTFYHPILYGTFCGACFGLTFYVLGYRSSGFMRVARTALVAFATFLSLSSGPLTAMVAQLGLITWDRVLSGVRHRWTVLLSGVAFLWGALALAANRSVPELFLTYFAFNPATAYNRIRIWEFGLLNVQQNPLLGTGMTGDWFRPWWMSGSMDMFWLVPAVKFGLPAGILMHLAFLGIFVAVLLKKGLSDRATAYRTGFLISLVGFYLAGWTVHYWKVIYVLFMLMLGAGAWLLSDAAQASRDDEAAETGPQGLGHRDSSFRRAGSSETTTGAVREVRYSRFAPKAVARRMGRKPGKDRGA